ncbi:MAG: cation diffusion facilitator family transporter [Patescibacteria group bacterium]|nr:cation diffusion facilitator family transporter [Patescibacteria group bacterium]
MTAGQSTAETKKNHNQNHKKEAVALSSILAGTALTGTKFVVGILTGSIGIMSEAAHSLLDLGAAGLTFYAVRFGGQPADEKHHYGHGKIESVSALIETGLLFLTSGWIIYEASHRLMTKNIEVEATWYAFAVVIFSILVDISRSRALTKVAQETKSQALEADALHFSSDIWSSTVVLVGLILVLFGVQGADALAAIGVSIFVAVAGWRLGKRTIDVLVDTAPQGITEVVAAIVKTTKGVVAVENIRVRPLGPNVFVDVAIQISRTLSLPKVEEIKTSIKERIIEKVPEADIGIRTSSVQLDNETIVESIQALAGKSNLTLHNIVVDNLDEKKYISFDLELEDFLTLRKSHEIATELEKAIKEEFGSDVEINSHIEPQKKEAILSSNVTAEEMAKVMTLITETDQQIKIISNLHNVLVRKIGERFFISLHCLAPAELSIEEVHNAVSRFEYLIKNKMPEIKRVVIHVEPKD